MKPIDEQMEKTAVLIANMVYEYQGADKEVQTKQVGKVLAGQTLKDIIQKEREEAYRAGKKHGIREGISTFMTAINDGPDKAIDIIETELLSELSQTKGGKE